MGLAEMKWPKWGLAVLFLVDGAGFGTWAAHVPVFKQLLHIENGSLTFVLISVIVGAIISMPVTGQLIARYGSRRVIRNVAISYVQMIGLLAQASSFWLLVIFAGLFGAAKGAFDISVNAQAMAVEKHYGRSSMSFLQGCWSAGGLLGAGAAGLMLQRQGTVRSDLSFTAGVLGLCCFLTLPMLVDEAVRPRAASKFVIGSLAVMVGLRQAMGVIVLCGIIVAVGPFFFPLQSTSRSSNEEVVTTGA